MKSIRFDSAPRDKTFFNLFYSGCGRYDRAPGGACGVRGGYFRLYFYAVEGFQLSSD